MSKKSILWLLILAVVILVVGGFYYFCKRDNVENVESEVLVGGDVDQHGCLGSAGYSWCEAKEKCLRGFEEFCADLAVELVDAISRETGVTLTNAGEEEFTWLVNQGEATVHTKISGVLFAGSDISRVDYEKIENYLNTTWQADMINLADGVSGGLRGYVVNYLACTLNFTVAELKNNEEGYPVPVNDKVKVKLACGFFNQNDVSKEITL